MQDYIEGQPTLSRMSPIPGVVGAVWCVVWVFMAFSSPQEHPRISEAELFHIERNLPKNTEMKVS